MQLQVKTLLNEIQHFAGFVYRDVRRVADRQGRTRDIEIAVAAHARIGGRCSRCRQPAPQYDRLPERRLLFVPLWGMVTWFLYAPRRVNCPRHGVVVEHIPWSSDKRRVTRAMMVAAETPESECYGEVDPDYPL